jgi:subtilisin family serine protease
MDVMQRRYFVRHKEIKIEEIEDVVAVRADPAAHIDARRQLQVMRAPPPVANVDAAALKPFERANWRFVTPTDPTREALSTHRAIAGSTTIGRLFRRENGSLAIGTNRLTVQLDAQLSEDQCKAALSEHALEVVRRLGFGKNLYEVLARTHRDSVEASEALQGDPRFLLAEPVFLEHVDRRAGPDDPQYQQQWQLNNTGQGGGVSGADIRAEEAWSVTRGAGIRVAVIDNGFEASHEDLAGAIDQMSGYFLETPSNDFRRGVEGMPNEPHGTFCAGIIGCRQNNRKGVSGVAPEASLMLVACLGDQVGSQLTLARAVAYCAAPALEAPGAPASNGADIIVSSLGPNVADWELTDTLCMAIEHAAAGGRQGRGCAIFWASSNGFNVDIAKDEVVSHPDVIAVGRSTNRDQEDNSARGPKLEYLAPGVDVYGATSGNSYRHWTGTSFAAPCAAGVAALALAVRPALTRIELRQLMVTTCDKIGALPYVNGRNDDYGYGRVNASRAVTLAAGQGVELVQGRGNGAARAQPGDGGEDGDVYRHEVWATSLDELRDFLKHSRIDFGCRPIARPRDGGFVTEVYASDPEIRRLQSARAAPSVRVTRRHNASAEGRARQSEASRSNRFAARAAVPRGLGIKE